MKRLVVLALVAALVLVVSGVAVATVPDRGNVGSGHPPLGDTVPITVTVRGFAELDAPDGGIFEFKYPVFKTVLTPPGTFPATYLPVHRYQLPFHIKTNTAVNVSAQSNFSLAMANYFITSGAHDWGWDLVWPYVDTGWVVSPWMNLRPWAANNPYSDDEGWLGPDDNAVHSYTPFLGHRVEVSNVAPGKHSYWVFYESQWNPTSDWWLLEAGAQISFNIVFTVSAS